MFPRANAQDTCCLEEDIFIYHPTIFIIAYCAIAFIVLCPVIFCVFKSNIYKRLCNMESLTKCHKHEQIESYLENENWDNEELELGKVGVLELSSGQKYRVGLRDVERDLSI